MRFDFMEQPWGTDEAIVYLMLYAAENVAHFGDKK